MCIRDRHCSSLGSITVETEENSEVGFADSDGIRQHGLEHRPQFAWRTRDDAQYLGCRGLLLQRLAQVVGALAQLVEQAAVLDGDDGLIGKRLKQCDLSFCEELRLGAAESDRA